MVATSMGSTPPDARPATGPRARLREAIGVVLLAALGCEVADFEIERRGTMTIRRGDAVEMMELDGMELEIAELEDEQGIGREDISDAQLVRLTMRVLEPEGMDLSFVDSIEVFAESEDLERVRVAHQDDFPPGVTHIELEPDDVELRDYIAAPQVTLVARISGASPTQDVRVRATAWLEVGVTVRGACDHR
jgi:hypothetical protein